MARRGIKRWGFIAAFLGPAALLYAVFVLGPMAQTFQLSTFYFSGMSQQMEPVGMENYQRLYADKAVWTSFQNVFVLLVVGGLLTLGLSLILAHATTGQSRKARLLRSVYLLPNIVSVVAVATVWRFVYHPQIGLMKGLGMPGPTDGWLGSTRTAMACITATFVWISLGFFIMLFAAGLRSIPEEVNEAAELEGVTGWHKFWRISWPLMHSVRRVAVVYLAVNAFGTFALVNVMTDGAPADSTQVVLNYLYRLKMNSQFGEAAALGAINFVVVLAVTLLIMAMFRRNPVEGRAR